VKSAGSPRNLLRLVAYLVNIVTRGRYVQTSQEHLEVNRLRWDASATDICDITMTLPVVPQSIRQALLDCGYH
jgi:hypothetical protein